MPTQFQPPRSRIAYKESIENKSKFVDNGNNGIGTQNSHLKIICLYAALVKKLC